MADKIKPGTPVRATTHPGDTRSNIPTAELESFARPEEKRPAIVRYPRNPDLDPQLVWKGKDEQDSHRPRGPRRPDLHPGDHRPARARRGAPRREPGPAGRGAARLLRAVHGPHVRGEGRLLPAPRQVVQPDDPGRLAARDDEPRREGGPQGPGPDHLHRPALRDQVRLELAGHQRASATSRTARTPTSRASPSRCAPTGTRGSSGIHSYLAYLRDRLVAARDLLTESGSLFVQIGDENVHLVRSLLDEVFGRDNFVGLITFQEDKRRSSGQTASPGSYDYLLWYARATRARSSTGSSISTRRSATRRSRVSLRRRLPADACAGMPSAGELARRASSRRLPSSHADFVGRDRRRALFPFEFEGRTYRPFSNRSWTHRLRKGMERLERGRSAVHRWRGQLRLRSALRRRLPSLIALDEHLD